ncbi:hypothetical protein GCM10023205_25180 [Yinghuangia aomiensis]|uniref:Uncharacterized protein n=1 Tax=Yinghuangia aomiensis TaxID=676205 RepID=A0ABP9H5M8_9ACTN
MTQENGSPLLARGPRHYGPALAMQLRPRHGAAPIHPLRGARQGNLGDHRPTYRARLGAARWPPPFALLAYNGGWDEDEYVIDTIGLTITDEHLPTRASGGDAER